MNAVKVNYRWKNMKLGCVPNPISKNKKINFT